MRINNNLMAMNTHRQLGMGQTAGAKSMEKLSSGFRINRAGDDAAGLSISEKMRAQIRGLNQASRNSQDGISMIQTAEGALGESQAILQRMRELAVQASNDTNVDIDRGAIQNEINQLSTEINRIGNTTEFNTQKLLDGGRQIKANAIESGARLTGGSAAAATNATPTVTAAGTTPVSAIWKSGAITLMANDTTNTVSFRGATVTLNTAATGVAATASNNTTGAVTVVNGSNQQVYAEALKSAFEAIQAETGSPLAGLTFTVDGAGAGAQLFITDTLANGATNNAQTITVAGAGSLALAQSATAATAGTNTAGITGVAASGTVAFSAAAQEGSFITMADKKVAFWNSAATTFANSTEAKATLGADFIVDVNGVGSGTAMATAVFNAVGAAGISGYTLSDGGAGTLTLTANAPGPHGLATLVGATNITAVAAATGSFSFSAAPTEGSSINIADQKIAFYDSSLGNYANDTDAKKGLGSDFAVDVKGLSASQVVDKLLTLQSPLNLKLTNDVNLGKNVSTNGNVNLVITAQATGFGGNNVALDTSEDSTAGFNANFQIGANTKQAMTVSMEDMRSLALGVTGKTAGSEAVANNGAKASYVQVSTVSNGVDNENTEFSLDLSSHTKASAAVSVINDAIEAVSTQRSQLGAFQNRLEHTIKNLDTSAENLQASESRIRDVDMAKEMMEFTKNNILTQAAQAMLAQANNAPQGVLQLLR